MNLSFMRHCLCLCLLCCVSVSATEELTSQSLGFVPLLSRVLEDDPLSQEAGETDPFTLGVCFPSWSALQGDDTPGGDSDDKEDVSVGIPCAKGAVFEDSKYRQRERLKLCLREKYVCFEDVQSIYGKPNGYASKGEFHTDILRLMFQGANIDERLGTYHYLGKIYNTFPPAEHVAVAMFKLLCLPQKSWFDVRFQLYTQGHRGYSLEALNYIERALSVGGVHPYDRPLISCECVDLSPVAKAVWEKVQDFSDENLSAFFSESSDRYVDMLRNKRYDRVIRHLWEWKKQKILPELQKMKERMLPLSVVSEYLKGAETGPSVIRSRFSNYERKACILEILQKNTNKGVALKHILQAVNAQKNSGCVLKHCDLLRVVLDLVLSQWPIVYDKEGQTVKIISERVAPDKPKENTNLMTMIYDQMQKYGNDVSIAELAYFAYIKGYWSQDFNKKGQRDFFDFIRRCRRHLAIYRHVDAKSCAKDQLGDIFVQRQIWCIVATEGVVKTLDYYKKSYSEVTQKDVDAVVAAHEFQKRPEYTVFSHHLAACAKAKNYAIYEEYVETYLRRQPLTESCFWVVCQNLGLQSQKEMWDFVGILARREKGGRLLYNPQTTAFSWSDSRVPHPEKNALLAHVFFLKNNTPDMSSDALCHMLRQDGFCDVSLDDVSEILQGLAVLGFYEPYAKTLTKERYIVRLLLTPGSHVAPEIGADGCMSWPWKVAQRVVSWVHNGSVDKLLRMKKSATVQNTEGDVPSAKRMKLHTCCDSSKDVIRLEMPVLYNILQKKRAKI